MVVESKKENLFSFSILTRSLPVVNNGKASCITVATIGGNISILFSHVPYITEIDYGIVEVKGKGTTSKLYLEDGIIEVAGNNINILVNKALYADQIDVNFIESEIERIKDIKHINIEEDNRNKTAIKRLQMQLDFVGKSEL